MTHEHKEECMANAYEQFLPTKDACYKINQLLGLIMVDELTEEEDKIINKMIIDRNYTGKGDPSFQDIRDNI